MRKNINTFTTLLSLITLYKDEYAHNYRRTHLEDFARRQKKYRQSHPTICAIHMKNLCKTHKNTIPSKHRLLLIKLIGDVCVRCGFSDTRALQIDHKNGGGTQESKKRGSHGMHIYYLKHPDEAKEKLQILCANCNSIKRFELREFGNKFKVINTGIDNIK